MPDKPYEVGKVEFFLALDYDYGDNSIPRPNPHLTNLQKLNEMLNWKILQEFQIS
jgi:hypothetical protein